MRAEALLAQREYDDSELARRQPQLAALSRPQGCRASGGCNVARRSQLWRTRPPVRDCTDQRRHRSLNQLALLGPAEGAVSAYRKRDRVIVSAIEHDSILTTCRCCAPLALPSAWLPCRSGYIEPAALSDLLGDDVALVSIMVANNETGVVQPIRELARGRAYRGRFVPHRCHPGVSAHSARCHRSCGVDAMTVAAHKIGGPVASGALYLKSRTPLRPRIFGGGQEAGRRAGTQGICVQLAFAAAARTLAPHVAQERATLQALSDKLYATLTAHPRIHATMGDYAHADRLPGMVSIYIDGMDSEELIIARRRRL